jgi:hypothetical protein
MNYRAKSNGAAIPRTDTATNSTKYSGPSGGLVRVLTEGLSKDVVPIPAVNHSRMDAPTPGVVRLGLGADAVT